DTCITTWPATCATTATISAHTSKKIGTPSALRSAARSTSWSARWTVTISISPVISCRNFSTARPHRTTTARSRTDDRSSRTGGSRGPTRRSCAWRSTPFRRTRPPTSAVRRNARSTRRCYAVGGSHHAGVRAGSADHSARARARAARQEGLEAAPALDVARTAGLVDGERAWVDGGGALSGWPRRRQLGVVPHSRIHRCLALHFRRWLQRGPHRARQDG